MQARSPRACAISFTSNRKGLQFERSSSGSQVHITIKSCTHTHNTQKEHTKHTHHARHTQPIPSVELHLRRSHIDRGFLYVHGFWFRFSHASSALGSVQKVPRAAHALKQIKGTLSHQTGSGACRSTAAHQEKDNIVAAQALVTLRASPWRPLRKAIPQVLKQRSISAAAKGFVPRSATLAVPATFSTLKSRRNNRCWIQRQGV